LFLLYISSLVYIPDATIGFSDKKYAPRWAPAETVYIL